MGQRIVTQSCTNDHNQALGGTGDHRWLPHQTGFSKLLLGEQQESAQKPEYHDIMDLGADVSFVEDHEIKLLDFVQSASIRSVLTT